MSLCIDCFQSKSYLIILTNFLTGILPALNVMVQFLAHWTLLWRRSGSSCDIQYRNITVQIFNLFLFI